jgi:hypothetical protein
MLLSWFVDLMLSISLAGLVTGEGRKSQCCRDVCRHQAGRHRRWMAPVSPLGMLA